MPFEFNLWFVSFSFNNYCNIHGYWVYSFIILKRYESNQKRFFNFYKIVSRPPVSMICTAARPRLFKDGPETYYMKTKNRPQRNFFPSEMLLTFLFIDLILLLAQFQPVETSQVFLPRTPEQLINRQRPFIKIDSLL